MRNLFVFLLVACTGGLIAQSYDAALGLRLGTEWGATAQLRLPQLHKNFVLEAIVQSSLSKEEGSLTLLGKQHRPLISRRLNLFYGGGLHAGWTSERDRETGEPFDGARGITGIVGMEATIGKVNLSYDFKPALNVTGGDSFLYTHTAVSVRYVLAKRNGVWNKETEKKIRQRRKDRERERRREERAQRDKRWYEVWRKG